MYNQRTSYSLPFKTVEWIDLFKDVDKFATDTKPVFDKFKALYDAPKSSSFPPYNIRKNETGDRLIEIALAGFSIDDIDIIREGNTLTVSGQREEKDSDMVYVEHGIALRNFSRVFTLSEDNIIKNAEMDNGMLSITLEKVVPESMKPIKVEINKGKKK